MRSRQNIKKDSKIRDFNILITGDENYNNITKFNITMQSIYEQIPNIKKIHTFGSVYGAELLARLYAQQQLTNYHEYSTAMFKTDKLKPAQLYHMMINIAIKSMDLVIIFSSIYNKKINLIIKKCKDEGIPYLIVKE